MPINIILPKDLQQFLERKVGSGRYSSPNEVVSEGLRLLEEQDKLKRVRRDEVERKLLIGVEQLNRNEGIPSSQVREQLRRSNLRSQEPKHD